jgi:hypothetical protein
MNIIFQINGGIGKSVMATAVCEAIKKAYPDPKDKLIVISGYPEVFIGNKNVHRAFNFGQTAYFYKDYIEGQEFKIMYHDPYMETSHIMQDRHLLKTWCEMFGLTYAGELPKIYITDREMDFIKKQVPQERPILLMQTNGGGEGQGLKYSWARDIPEKVAIEVINQFKATHNIVHIRRDDQPGYQGTIPVQMHFRQIAALFPLSDVRFFMDSFAQHTAAALNFPSTVLWIANKPTVFGYEMHDNILSKEFSFEPELRHSFLHKFNIAGDPMEYPYEAKEDIFDTDLVLESLYKQLEKNKQEPKPEFKAEPPSIPELQAVENEAPKQDHEDPAAGESRYMEPVPVSSVSPEEPQ